MTQEKKVIRVLQPTKKAKKVSPMLFGIIGTAFGVVATSILLFTFLKDDSNVSAIQTQTEATVEATSSNTQRSENPFSKITEQSDETINSDEHEGFNQPQPKMNEITQVFQHKKNVPIVEPVEPKPSSSNPFDVFGQQAKPAPALDSKAKLTDNAKTTQAKLSQVPPTLAKPLTKTEQLAAKNSPKELSKAKLAEKEADFEVPHATVQIAVSRSVKE
ncbi:MAG: hypothetical protein H9855_00235 [Candidatus Acinetobacter avistercoris]|uniref:hypothetical protein n=1 Tax=Acinetobacter sp. KS-LM10 TaxID=3120518 RepID=UPI001F8F0C48|nr:hypothetical protein [Candidatus Acinetobacter avistercoris]